MNLVKQMLSMFGLILAAFSGIGHAGESDPLFVNLTSDEPHRAKVAIVLGKSQFERGHPLTVFLNDRGVFLASKANAAKYPEQQQAMRKVIEKGATVFVCAMCLKHYGIKEVDLLPGIKVANRELTGAALFKGNTRTLSW